MVPLVLFLGSDKSCWWIAVEPRPCCSKNRDEINGQRHRIKTSQRDPDTVQVTTKTSGRAEGESCRLVASTRVDTDGAQTARVQTEVRLYYVDIITADTIDGDGANANKCRLRPITPPAATLEALVNNIPALKCLLAQHTSRTAH